MVPVAILERTDLTLAQKCIYAVVRDAMWGNGTVTIGIRQILKRLGLGGTQTVVDGIRALEQTGDLIVERGGPGQRTVYRLPVGTDQSVPISRTVDETKVSQKLEHHRPKNQDTTVPETRTLVSQQLGHGTDQTSSRLIQTSARAPSKKQPAAKIRTDCLAIYEAYPKKVGKGAALKAIAKALTKIGHAELLTTVQAFANSPAVRSKRGTQDWQYVPHPATWFNQERWADAVDSGKRAVNPYLGEPKCPTT